MRNRKKQIELKNSLQVKDLLIQTVNDLVNEEIESDVARAIIGGCELLLKIFEIEEIDKYTKDLL